MYSKFIHYGCSFTYGQDSGGFEIDDPSKSYPAHLGKMTGIDFINRSNKGASLEQIALKILEDLTNPLADIHHDNVLVVINLTSAFRIMSSLRTWWTSNINDHKFNLCNINPSTSDDISKEITDIKKKLIYEEDWIMYFSAVNIINSICNQLKLHKIDFVFVDIILDINNIIRYFPLHKNLLDKCVMFGKKQSGIVRYIADQGKIYHDCYSESQHYNSKGYKLMANLIFEKLKVML